MSNLAEIGKTRALARTVRIREHLGFAFIELADAFRDSDWIELGYSSWTAYLAGEFPVRPQLARADQPEVFHELTAVGMSQRQVAATTGVNQATVSRSISDASASDDDLDGDDIDADPPSWPIRPVPQSPTKDVWTTDESRLQDKMRAGETIVVSMRGPGHARIIAWADQHGHLVRVDRKTMWGNPFVIPDDGDRDQVIAKYRKYYLPHKPALLSTVGELKGLALACWCAPAACHGDVLAAMADRVGAP